MSLRATTDHIDDYGREHLFEIYDDQWGGSVTALKNTGRGFGQFSHQVLDPRKPWENPIQKGVLELSVWLSSTSLLDDIKDGDEQQFHIIHKIDASQEWAGYIYNDLTTYEENILPFRVTLVAKDFTDLGGKDYKVSGSLPDDRETVITTIAYLLNEVGFDIPIKTHTSWIEDNINSSQDYLRQIYHETKALREFGRTGDESDEAITVEDALEKLCSNHKLILKQTGGCYWIDQLTEYDNPASVQETVYDIDGTLDTSESNVDTTVSANTTDLKVVISSDNRDNSGIPGLKRAKVKFDHRTKVSNIEFPSSFTLPDDDSTYSQFFQSDGNQVIRLSGSIEATLPNGTEGTGTANIRVHPTGYWWDGDWQTSTASFAANLSLIGPDGSGNYVYQGNFAIVTDATPADADGTLEIEFFQAGAGVDTASKTVYRIDNFEIENGVASENSTSIDYQLTQSGAFSVVEKFPDDWYGDGPIGYAVSAFRHGSGDGDTTSDSWGRRGQTADKNFHENQLKEVMDTQRGWRRLLSALLKGTYYPHNVLSYDSEFFYYLGGRWDLFTGNFQADLFSLDIETGTDTFEDLPKFTDETGSGTGSSGGSTGGLDQSTADARYVNISGDTMTGDLTVNGAGLFDIGTDEFRIRDGAAMLVVDGATGQIGLGAEPLDDVGLLLDTPARAVTDNTDYDRLKVTNSGALTIAASTTSPIVATAQFDEPNINLASGAAVTNAATVYIEDAPTEGDDNWALYAPSGATLLESLNVNGSSFVDSSRNVSANRGTFTDYISINTANDIPLRITSSDAVAIINLSDSNTTNDRFVLRNGDKTLFYSGGNIWADVPSSGLPNFGQGIKVNSQLLFTAGNEQLLSRDATATFAQIDISDGSSRPQIYWKQNGNNQWHLEYNESSGGLVYVESGVAVRHQFLDGGGVFLDGNTQTDSLTVNTSSLSGYTANINGSMNINGVTETNGLNSNGEVLIDRSSGILLQFANSGSDKWHWELDGGDLRFVESGVAFRHRMYAGGRVDINGVKLFDVGKEQTLSDDADVNFGDVTDLGFSSGWIADGGQGYGVTQDPDATAQWNAEFNDLLIRGTLKVFELIIKQISVLGGTEILSVAAGKVDSVSGSAGSETVEVQDPRGFGGTSVQANDLILVQRVDLNDQTVVKQEFRTVSSVTGTSVSLTSTSGAPAPSDALAEGDVFVTYGNTSDSARQAMIYRNVDKSSGNAVVRVQDGVDSYSDFNSPSTTTKVAYGDINGFGGFTSQTWGFFAKDNFVVELDGGNMKLGKNVGGAGVDGIHIDADDYWYTDGTGSVGDGILNWDASTPEVNLAGFTATTDKLSADFGTSGQVVMSTQSTKVIGITKTGTFGSSDNYVRMFAFDDDAWGLQGRDSGGNLIFRLGDTNQIAGANFDASGMWSTNNSNTFKGTGFYIDWIDEQFSLGGEFWYDSAKLFLDGTFEVSAAGEITNSAGDYEITSDGIRFLSDQTLMFGGAANTAWIEGNGNSLLAHTNTFQFEALDDTVGAQIAGSDQIDSWIGGATFGGANFKVSAPGGSAPTYVGVDNVPLRLPRFTTTERDNISSPQTGYVIYNTTAGRPQYYNGTSWSNF